MQHTAIEDLVSAMVRHQLQFRDAVIRRIRSDVSPQRLAALLDDLEPSLDRLLPAVFHSLGTGESLDAEELLALRDLAEGWAVRGASLRSITEVAVAAGKGAREMTVELAGGSHLAVAISFGEGVRVAQEVTTAIAGGHARGAWSRLSGAVPRRGAATSRHSSPPIRGSVQEPPVAECAPHQDTLRAPRGDVLRLVAEGRTNGEIAATLYLSRQAVNYHVGRLMRTVAVGNRTALVARAYETGMLRRSG